MSLIARRKNRGSVDGMGSFRIVSMKVNSRKIRDMATEDTFTQMVPPISDPGPKVAIMAKA